MEITYVGHSCFKLKGKKATVVTDPYLPKVTGFVMPSIAADIVTISHNHDDHNAADKISGTSRREKPYVIAAPGEYEVSGVGVFGWGSYHDDKGGADRGKNTIYTIHIDGVAIGHLGDLGHSLSEEQVANIGLIDVLLVPVGGYHTISPETAAEVIAAIQPSYAVPMHYQTEEHNQDLFAKVTPLTAFLKVMGDQYQTKNSLEVSGNNQPEETEIVVLTPNH